MVLGGLPQAAAEGLLLFASGCERVYMWQGSACIPMHASKARICACMVQICACLVGVAVHGAHRLQVLACVDLRR